MSTQSKELTAFYRSYAAWLDEGAPRYEPFSRRTGLCYNLRLYAGANEELLIELHREMRAQFIAAELAPSIPFSNEGWEYCNETDENRCYLNPARIQWVKDHANV